MEGVSLEEKLSRFLHKYRITPHSTTGISPSELLMGKKLRSRLDLLYPDISHQVEGKQLKQKSNHDKKQSTRIFANGSQYMLKISHQHLRNGFLEISRKLQDLYLIRSVWKMVKLSDDTLIASEHVLRLKLVMDRLRIYQFKITLYQIILKRILTWLLQPQAMKW